MYVMHREVHARYTVSLLRGNFCTFYIGRARRNGNVAETAEQDNAETETRQTGETGKKTVDRRGHTQDVHGHGPGNRRRVHFGHYGPETLRLIRKSGGGVRVYNTCSTSDREIR